MPLALMRSADRVPINSASSELRPVFGLSQSSVTTDIASAPFSPSRSPSQRCRDADGVQAEAASGFLYSSCRTMTAQAIRAILLASANETNRNGRRSSSALTHAECPSVLPGSRRITAVAPMVSKRLR